MKKILSLVSFLALTASATAAQPAGNAGESFTAVTQATTQAEYEQASMNVMRRAWANRRTLEKNGGFTLEQRLEMTQAHLDHCNLINAQNTARIVQLTARVDELERRANSMPVYSVPPYPYPSFDYAGVPTAPTVPTSQTVTTKRSIFHW